MNEQSRARTGAARRVLGLGGGRQGAEGVGEAELGGGALAKGESEPPVS